MHPNTLYSLLFLTSISGCGGIVSSPAPVEEPSQTRSVAHARVPGVPVAKSLSAQPGAAGHSELLFQVLSSIGVDYRYGGNSHVNGFDCSGLVAHVFREGYGIALPRHTLGQSQVGRPVSAEQLEPGDLVFYNTLDRPFSHVGIYLGAGRFVHAPKAGSAVRVENLTSSYWTKRWNGARRIAVQM